MSNETNVAGMNGAPLQSRRAFGFRGAALATVSAAVLGVALTGAPSQALAQDAAEAQEVVVTGSRIVRRDYTSNSPIVTVDARALEQTQTVALEATLNKMPQFTPDQDLNGRQSRDFAPTGAHSVGVSTLSLRGLGPNRNLVLVDGKRQTPVNGQMVVDLNGVPSSMVERIEVITGGASAVYGADAVGGVVNFILKKNFQGLDFDTQWGKTEAGDGREFKASVLMGTNFADGRGNVTIGIERYSRAPSYQRNREFYTKGFADPTVGTNEGIFVGAGFQSDATNSPNQNVVNSLFPNRPAGTTIRAAGPTYYFNTDGTVFTGANGNGTQGGAGAVNYKGVVDGQKVAYFWLLDSFSGFTPQRGLKTNSLNFYVTSPMSRWSIFQSGHYDINDWLTVSLKANYSRTKTRSIGTPSTFINGWSTVVARDADHPVSPQLATLLDSRPNPTAPWNLHIAPDPNDGGWFPERGDIVDNQIFQITAGLDGRVPGTDWTWELFGSRGEAAQYYLGVGFASLERYEAFIRAPNYGRNASITGNPGAPGFGFNAGTGTCTSGFYSTIFEGGRPSQDCIDSIKVDLQSYMTTVQNIVEFNTQGSLFKLPAGDLQASLGASYRDNALKFTPDAIQNTTSFVDQTVGLQPIQGIDAKIITREVFGEMLVPLLRDQPFAQELNLELGARYSTYTNANSGLTYKILGDYQLNDWMRFRGGYNLSVRAPNLAESFVRRQAGFGVPGASAYGDPCSLRATAPYGANPATNAAGAAGAAQAEAICRVLMGPTGSANFYGLPPVATSPTASGGFFELGNPDLDTEKAHTYTAGVVLRSPFQHPLLSRFSASIDWYSIKVNGAIQLQAADTVQAACLTQSGPAATVAVSPACRLLLRNGASGNLSNTTVQYDNLGRLRISGIDFTIDWAANFSDMGWGLNSIPGQLSVRLAGNYVDTYRTSSLPGQPFREWAGTLGPTLTGTNQGVYKYKFNLNVGYSTGPLTVGLGYRFRPRIHPITYGQPGNNTLSTGSSSLVDLNASWDFANRYTLRGGIENVFDVEPNIVGANLGIAGNRLASTFQGTTNESLYDALGRRFYVGLKAKF